MSKFLRTCLQIAPTATLDAVSLADDLSNTFLASSKSYFKQPTKSACPGLTFSTIFPFSSMSFIGDIYLSQFSKSLFFISKEIGAPIVFFPLTPPIILILSFSIFILPPRPYPP